tara:strand:+ start:187 stop:810 length:624 start_codon:yes stop_codon:yes gene_type:complete
MAWTAPRTWSAGEVVTAALLNTHIRDNQLVTGAAKVTTAGDITYATAANALARLGIGSAGQALLTNSGATAPEWGAVVPLFDSDYDTGGLRTTASLTYVDLTGAPSVSMVTGASALALYRCEIANASANQQTLVSCRVSGATTIAADDQFAMMWGEVNDAGARWGLTAWRLFDDTLTPGTNDFTLQARVGGGTASAQRFQLGVIAWQ